jgi:preprotein translocase subunit Sec63
MTADPLTHLKTLGLESGASREEVKKAFRDLSKVWHPDRFAEDPALQKKAGEKLQAINDAYKRLQDYEPLPDSGPQVDGGRQPIGRKMGERVLQPRKRFNPSERLPLVMAFVAILVVVLLILTAI